MAESTGRKGLLLIVLAVISAALAVRSLTERSEVRSMRESRLRPPATFELLLNMDFNEVVRFSVA